MKKLTITTLVIALAFVVVSATPSQTLAKENKGGQTFREKIEAQIKKLQDKLFKFENNQGQNNNDHGDRDDDCIPFGIKNAKGIEKRVENGKGLPPGIAKKIGDNKFCNENNNGTSTPPTGTTTPHVLMPRILDINVFKATSTATISWKTNKTTVGDVRFSTATPIASNSAVLTDANLSTLHTVSLTNLTPNTVYYYVVTARDASGNVKESVTKQFQTNALAQVDTTAPTVVYSAKVDILATSTRLVWITNEPTTGKIWISTSTPVDNSATSTASDATLSYFHNVFIGNLATSTTYYYTIMSTDAVNNSMNLTGNSFTTLAQ